MSTERVLFAVKNNIAYVALNRPEKLNGLDMAMFKALISTAKKIRKNTKIRAVILSGKGDSFCAGLDFNALSKDKWMAPKLFLKWPWTRTNIAQEVADCWRKLPVPVLCVIHGNCFGGGMQIALGCDFRFAKPDANFSIMEMKWGLIPDMSGTLALSKLTQLDTAMALTMTGRQFNAMEGKAFGLITECTDTPVEAAELLAKDIVKQSPDAVAATKRLFQKTWNASETSALRWERWIQARLLGRKNNRIAIANGLTKDPKRKKQFEDRSLF